MALHTGHRARVKEKFRNDGFDQFADHEVLEALLFYPIPYRDTNPIAHQLIERAGSLARVFSLGDTEIGEVPYCGDHTSLFLHLTAEIAKRCLEVDADLTGYANETARRDLVRQTVKDVNEDEVHLLLFDNHFGLLDSQRLFVGSCTSPAFRISEIITSTLRAHASTVIVVSTHASRIARPTPYEVEATTDILRQLELMDIRLLDHYIVGGSTVTSTLNLIHTKAQAIREQNTIPLFRIVSQEEVEP